MYTDTRWGVRIHPNLYLMFIAGTEVDLKKVLRTNRALMKRISVYLLLLYLFSISFTLYFDLGKIFIVLLPLISVGLVVTLSKEYGKTPWLTLGMTAGGIGEVISIAALTMTATALQEGFGLAFLKSMAVLILFIFIIYLLFRALQILFWWFPGVGTALMPHDDNKEQDLRISIGILFILVAVMLYLHLELAFGAFIAGIFIPTFFIHKQDLGPLLGDSICNKNLHGSLRWRGVAEGTEKHFKRQRNRCAMACCC